MRILVFTLIMLVMTNLTWAQPTNPPVGFGIDVNFAVPSGLKPGDSAPDFSASDAEGKLFRSQKS